MCDGTLVEADAPSTSAPAETDCAGCRRLQRRYERERVARLESESIAEEFTRRAMHDSLTGLGNRELFVDQLGLALERCRRLDTQVGVLFLDLDDFKVVNDTLGHTAGDLLLAEVGLRLRECVPGGDIAARLGGDEFVVLCGTGDVAELRSLAEEITERVLQPFVLEGHSWQTACSIGIRVASGDETAEEVLRDADTALYAAKAEGKGRLNVFTEGTRSRLVDRVRIVGALRNAIAADMLQVWFQPIVTLGTGDIVGAEALSRWSDAERGMVPPEEFIALASEMGDLGSIGAQVMESAFRQTLSWHHQPGWVTHVNVHPSELADPLLPDRAGRLLDLVGLPGEAICLEITEQTLVSEDDVVRRNVGRLRDLGMGLAIDDFGVSYSSFSYLKRLPITALKIDRSFVAGVGSDQQDDAIVAAVVAMAEALNLSTVAEGIEEPRQAERLVELGVTEGQGWLYAPAVAPAEWAGTVARLADGSRAPTAGWSGGVHRHAV